VFRAAVQDIASTPEGAVALARFNAGDEIGALAVLDQLIDARERARQIRTNIETAAERRRVAVLALAARGRGRLSTSDVIGRFETVTGLDADFFSDWLQLSALYRDAGDLAQARESARRALDEARFPIERARALAELGNVARADNDRWTARRHFIDSLDGIATVAAADPGNQALQIELARAHREYGEELLGRVGMVSNMDSDGPGALQHAEQAATIVRQLVARDAGNILLQRELALCEESLGDALIYNDRDDEARAHYAAERIIVEHIARIDPTGLDLEVFQSVIDLNMARTLWGTLGEHANTVQVESHFRASAGRLRRLVATDPSNVRLQLLLGEVLTDFSGFWKWGVGDDAQQYAAGDEALAVFQSLRERGQLPASHEVYVMLAGGGAMRRLPVPRRVEDPPERGRTPN
jgi:tetratricopeptide (TPR) repeat protein